MGGHGHGHGPPYVVPDYKTFTIKGIKELEYLEQELKKKGLRDPWIRNEAWRFAPGFGTKGQRAVSFFFRGFPLGLGLAVITAAIGAMVGGDDGHGHGHGHGHGDGHGAKPAADKECAHEPAKKDH